MADNPLESLARAAAQDENDSFDGRVARQRRIQTTARRVRKTLRWSILVLAILGVSLFYFGSGNMGLQVLGFFCFLLVLALGTALFFMGGLAPGRVRRGLSDRERSLLDN